MCLQAYETQVRLDGVGDGRSIGESGQEVLFVQRGKLCFFQSCGENKNQPLGLKIRPLAVRSIVYEIL